MRKAGCRLIALFLVLVLGVSFALTGCNGGQKEQDTVPAATSDKKDGENTNSDSASTSEQAKQPLKGTVTLSWSFGAYKPLWEAIARSYMEKNPGVTVVLDEKEGRTYVDWLGTQLAGGNPTADIVISNEVVQYYAEKKFVDYSEYIVKPNPYAGGQKWKDIIDRSAYAANGPNGEIYTINTDSVVTAFFYNKDIFNKVGVEAPKDWDELVEVCKKLNDAGYIPISTAGDASAFWAWQMGWLFRVYTDQYFRDMEPLAAAQPGDYNYDEELQANWKFDPKDKANDAEPGYVQNKLRLAKMIVDGEVGPSHERFKEMMTNFKKIFPDYVEEGFFGTDNTKAVQYFIQGQAAMWIDIANFAAGFDRIMKDNQTEKFELGSFNYPPMKGKVAVDYTRTVGGAHGFFSVINKSKEQNDLNVDFIMYLVSPEGQAVKFNAMEQNNIAPSGPPLVKGVEMPEKWRGIFEQLGFPGLADGNPFSGFSRGFMDEPRSVRAFQDNSQKFFKGEMSVDEYCAAMQKACQDAVPRWLKIQKFRPDAIDDPSKDPSTK